jgi:nucleotidyltransferase substrate binding protein (TIGR01987 family)
MTEDIRWKQRFDNYGKAFHELQEGLELAQTRPLSKLEKQGVIQGFEYTHELAWNLLKDYLQFQGHVGLIGSRDTTREAFKRGLIANGDTWMEMIKSRNLTSHAYDKATAEQIYTAIAARFFPEFQNAYAEFSRRSAQEV